MKRIVHYCSHLWCCTPGVCSCTDTKGTTESGKHIETSQLPETTVSPETTVAPTTTATKTPETNTPATPETTEPLNEKDAFEGTMSDILGRIIEKAIVLDTDKEYGIATIECSDVPVDEDSCTDILGLSTEDFNNKVEAALESKPNGSWFSHSVVSSGKGRTMCGSLPTQH